MKKRIFALILCAAMLLALGTTAGAAPSLDKYLEDTLSPLQMTRVQMNSEGDDVPPAEYTPYYYWMRWDDTLGIGPEKVTHSMFGTNSIDVPVKLMQGLLSYDITLIAYDTGEITLYLPNELENTWVGANGSIGTGVHKADSKPKGTIGSAWQVYNDDSEDGFAVEFKLDRKRDAKDLALAYRLTSETKWRVANDAEFLIVTYEGYEDTYYAMCTNYSGLPSGAYAIIRK